MPRGIAIVGATGFVGSAVLRQLDSHAFSPVHILVRDPAKLPREIPARFRIFSGQLTDIPRGFFPEEPFSLVHLATKQIDRDGSGFVSNNIDGTRQLLKSLPPSIQAIVYGSSASVYGQGAKSGATEAARLRPETPLAKSRLAAEELILKNAEILTCSAYCLRPRFLFGPGDRHTIPGLTKMVRYGIQLGDGSQVHSVINVDDYAAVILTLAARSRANERLSLNTAYGDPLAFRRLVEFICGVSRLPAPRIRVPVSERITAALRSLPLDGAQTLATRLELFGLSQWLDISLLRSLIGNSILGQSPLRALEGTQ